MLVVERLLGLRAAGGVYMPLGSAKGPRGMVAKDAEQELGSGFAKNDLLAADEFREKLAWALGQVASHRRSHARGRARRQPRLVRLERRLLLSLDLPV